MTSNSEYTGVDNLEAMEAARNYREYLLRLVTDLAGPPKAGLRLVDFGAGAGTYAAPLAERGYDVTCVELDAGLRRRIADQGLTAAPSVEEFAESFDVAYTFNVLEHIDDDVSALRDLFKATTPGGRLLVYVPAFPVLYTSMDAKVGHVRRYRRTGLVEAVESAGFTVDDCRYADSLGFPATLVFKLLGNRKGDIGSGGVGAYDRFVFPASRVLDRVAGRAFGKNLVLWGRRP